MESDFGWAVQVMATTFQRWGMPAVEHLPGGPRGYLVLAAISQGRLRSQLALARHLGVDKTVMTYLLDKMEEAGLVTRRPDPADRRARTILITPAGKRALAKARDDLSQTESRLLSALTPEQAETFRDLLELIARDVHEQQNGRGD